LISSFLVFFIVWFPSCLFMLLQVAWGEGVAFLENWKDTAAWVKFEDKVYILLTFPPSLTSPVVWSCIAQEKLTPLDYQPNVTTLPLRTTLAGWPGQRM